MKSSQNLKFSKIKQHIFLSCLWSTFNTDSYKYKKKLFVIWRKRYPEGLTSGAFIAIEKETSNINNITFGKIQQVPTNFYSAKMDNLFRSSNTFNTTYEVKKHILGDSSILYNFFLILFPRSYIYLQRIFIERIQLSCNLYLFISNITCTDEGDYTERLTSLSPTSVGIRLENNRKIWFLKFYTKGHLHLNKTVAVMFFTNRYILNLTRQFWAAIWLRIWLQLTSLTRGARLLNTPMHLKTV